MARFDSPRSRLSRLIDRKSDESKLAQQQSTLTAYGNKWQQTLRRLGTAFVVTCAAVTLRLPGSVGSSPAFAKQSVQTTKSKVPHKQGATSKKKKANSNDMAQGYGNVLTFGLTGGLILWSVKSAQKEDENEQKQIRDETERLEQMQKEYTDIDEGVVVDEDLFASLNKRMNSLNATKDGDTNSASATDVTNDADERSDASPPTPSSGGGGAATLEPPGSREGGDQGERAESPQNEAEADGGEAEEPGPQPGATEEDVARLKRMFGGM